MVINGLIYYKSTTKMLRSVITRILKARISEGVLTPRTIVPRYLQCIIPKRNFGIKPSTTR